MEIKIATIDDANDLYELNMLFGNNATVEIIKSSLTENDYETVCIASIDGGAVGFCCGRLVKSMCYSEGRMDIEAVFVKQRYRGQGIGRALIQYLETTFSERGICHFHNGAYLSNLTALSLYANMGYLCNGEVVLEKTIERP